MTEVKEISKNLYFTLYRLLKAGQRPAQICKELLIKKQKLNYYVSFLKKQGIIRRVGYGEWEILKDLNDSDLETEVKKRSTKKSSLGKRIQKPLTNIHAFNIKFPILSGTIQDKDWEIKNKLMNWLPKYKKLDAFEGMTVRNNNNKSISIFLYPRDADFVKDPYYVEKLGFKIKSYLFEYFKTKHDVILDVMEAETKNLHLETRDDDKLQGTLKKGEFFQVDLGRKAAKIFPKDDRAALAWLDNSPDPNRIGTTDTEYKRELLFMPFRVRSLLDSLPAIQEYNKNLALHLAVQEKQLENLELSNHLNLENLKTQKRIQLMLGEEPLPGHGYRPFIRKINGKLKLKQKTLYDFF